jgi:hypothetical protein
MLANHAGNESVPGSIPVGAIVETRMAWASLPPGSLSIYFCQLIPHVIMLVFLLVLVAIQEEIYLKFRWL